LPARWDEPRATVQHRDRTILLVDDVLTTGATACESVRVLSSFGIRTDGVLVVAAV